MYWLYEIYYTTFPLTSPLPLPPSLSPPLGFIVFLLSIFSLDSVLILCRNILILKAIHPLLLLFHFLFHLLGQCLQ